MNGKAWVIVTDIYMYIFFPALFVWQTWKKGRKKVCFRKSGQGKRDLFCFTYMNAFSFTKKAQNLKKWNICLTPSKIIFPSALFIHHIFFLDFGKKQVLDSISCFKKCILLIWKDRVPETRGQTEKESPLNSLNDHNGKDWARSKSGGMNSI